jgi:hypothetical protein
VLDISLAGLIGAFVGTIVAGVNYHLFIGAMERAMHKPEHTPAERDAVEAKLSVLRRVVLTVELLFFAGLGYWIGKTFWG